MTTDLITTYLFISGIDGTGTVSDLGSPGTCFELLDYGFLTDGEKPQIAIQFGLSPIANRLIDTVFNNTTIESLHFISVKSTLDGLTIISDLVVNDAKFEGVNQSQDGVGISISYDSYTMTAHDAAGDPAGTFGVNYFDNKEQFLNAPLTFTHPIGVSAFAGAPVHWYLTIGGVTGTINSGAFKGSFEIENFSLEQTYALLASGDRGHMFFNVNLGNAADELAELALSGAFGKTVQLRGVAANGVDILYDLRLFRPQVEALAVSSRQADSIELSFQAMTLTTKPSDGPAETVGYSATSNTLLTEPIAAPTPGNDNRGLPVAAEGDWVMMLPNLPLGVATSTVASRGLELISMEYTLTKDQPFGNVTVTFDNDVADNYFLYHLLQSSKGLRTTLYQTSPSSNSMATELTLQGARVVSMDTNADNTTTVVLDPISMSLTTANRAPGGKVTYETITENAAHALSTTKFKPVDAPAGKAYFGGTLTYYLAVDGVDGGERGSRRDGFFALETFQFDVQQIKNGAIISPLSMTLDLGSAETDLLAMFLHDTAANWRVVGYTKSGQLDYDLRLGGATIERIDHASDNFDALTVDYDRFTQANRNKDGKLVLTGWDNVDQKVIDAGGVGAAKAVTDNGSVGGQGTHDTIFFYGIAGPSVTSDLTGGFQLDALTFSVERVDGAPIDTVSVSFQAGTALSHMTRALFKTGFDGVTIVESRMLESGQLTTKDNIDFDTMMVSRLEFDSSNGVTMQMTGSTFSMTRLDATDTTVTSGTDIKTGSDAVATGTGLANNPSTNLATNDETFYLNVSGVDGGTESGDHKQSFIIDDFQFSFSRSLNPVTKNGSGGYDVVQSGVASFDAVSIHFKAGGAADDFLALLSKDITISAVEIVSDGTYNGKNFIDFDFLLNDVDIQSFERGENGDTLVLVASDFGLRTTGIGKGGTSTNFDFAYSFGAKNTISFDDLVHPDLLTV